MQFMEFVPGSLKLPVSIARQEVASKKFFLFILIEV